MNISKDIKPITYLKSRAPDLLKQINQTHRPVVITLNGEPRAVLQDPHGKQKRVKGSPTIEGLEVDEFIRRNADPIWLLGAHD